MQPAVYILATKRNGTLYIGVTSDIRRRLSEHETGAVGFTRRYHVRRLVYLEFHKTITGAITREKQLKEWRSAWKIRLIEENNPEWADLKRELVVMG